MKKARHSNNELKNAVKILNDAQLGKNRILEVEHVIHRQCIESIEQMKKEIFERKNKILENLKVIYDKELLKLEQALQNENLEYSNKCFDIQKQNQMLLSKIHAAQEILESSDQEIVARTTQEFELIIKQLHLDDQRPPHTRIFRLQHEDISDTNISNLLGNVYLETDMVSTQPDVRSLRDLEKTTDRHGDTDIGKREQMEVTIDKECDIWSDGNQQHMGDCNIPSGLKQTSRTETSKALDCNQQANTEKATTVIDTKANGVNCNTQRCHTNLEDGLYHDCVLEMENSDQQRKLNSCEVMVPYEDRQAEVSRFRNIRLQSTTEQSKQSSQVLSRRVVKVKGSENLIKVIVPLESNRMWIAVLGHKKLLLINSSSNILTKGRLVKESKEIGNIVDAKKYNNNILVTCGESKILQLSNDGQSTSVFTDLNTYRAMGLCVTQCLEVLVCVQRSTDKNKVVRLDTTGGIIQIFHQDSSGAALYRCPDRVVSLSTGEIVVAECDSGKVVGVNNEGRHLFTWTGEMIVGRGNRFRPRDIINDKNDNILILDDFSQCVHVINKDGVWTKSLVDETHCMASAHTISVNTLGQLIVGCNHGQIAILTY